MADPVLYAQVVDKMVAAQWSLGPRPLHKALIAAGVATSYGAVYRARMRALQEHDVDTSSMKRVNWRTFFDLNEWQLPDQADRDETFALLLRFDTVSRAFFHRGLPADGVKHALPFLTRLSEHDPFVAVYLIWELGCRYALIKQRDALREAGVTVPKIFDTDKVFADVEAYLAFAPWTDTGLGGGQYQRLVDRGIVPSLHTWAMFVAPLCVSDAEVPHVRLLREWVHFSLWNPPQTVVENFVNPDMTPRFAIDGRPINWNTVIHLAEKWDRDAWKEQQQDA